MDESYVYSQVATVDIQEVEKFALVPNPASESVQVALSDWVWKSLFLWKNSIDRILDDSVILNRKSYY